MSTTTPDQQLSLTEAIEAAQDAADGPAGSQTLTDDRVVNEALTCHCGRPAGADGQCTAHRMETAGDAIGNHGRRL